MVNPVCIHFISIEEDQIKCKLGHKASIDSSYCFKGCPDYKPGHVLTGDAKKENQILELLSHGEEWTINEINQVTKLKDEK